MENGTTVEDGPVLTFQYRNTTSLLQVRGEDDEGKGGDQTLISCPVWCVMNWGHILFLFIPY